MRADELVGPAEIAARLHVAASTVSCWRTRNLLPAPVAVISRVPVWTWQAIREWSEDTGRVAGIDAAAIKSARAALPGIRQAARRELAELARTYRGALAERMGRAPRKLTGDGRGNGRGEWDSFFALSRTEREHLARVWMAPEGLTPDQYSQAMADYYGGDDVEVAFAGWLVATRVTDAARALKSGRGPTGVELASGWDLERLFSEDGAAYVAERWAEDADNAQWREDHAAPVLVSAEHEETF